MNKIIRIICKILPERSSFVKEARRLMTLACMAYLVLITSCRKVDDHAGMIADQPWLADHFSNKQVPSWVYPTVVKVGDTVTFIGDLFPDRPGTVITLGDVPVKIVDAVKLAPIYTTYSKQAPVDMVRFVVTADMGAGKRKPVTVTANGVTIEGTPIDINFFLAGKGRTDTTLWVDQLANWLPSDAATYATKGNAFLQAVHVDGLGNIYFNNISGLYKVSGGQTSNVLKVNDGVTDDKNGAFTIRTILGNAISFDGNSLYFSAEVVENTPDTALNYVYRLCKMDVNTKVISTLNRTLVMKGNAATDETGVHFEGPLGQLKVVAAKLQIAVNNELYFTNEYSKGSTTHDHKGWHSEISTGQLISDYFNSFDNTLICRVDVHGNLNVLLYVFTQDGIPSPGLPVNTGYFFLDPSAKYIYGYTQPGYVHYQLAQFDIQEGYMVQQIADYSFQKSFAFNSYENDPAYKYTSRVMGMTPVDPFALWNGRMQLEDGSVLLSGRNAPSLTSFDLKGMTAYCYAGTEIGVKPNVRVPAAQNQLTGPAKWVNYKGVSLIGQDRTGAVYYCKGMTDYKRGVVFYKLYSKK